MMKAAFFNQFLSRSCCISQNRLFSQIPTKLLTLRSSNPLCKLKSCRYMMDGPGREVSPTVEAALKAKDKIPKDFRIIYRAPLEIYVKVTYTAAFIGMVSIPIFTAAIHLANPNITYPIMLTDDITLFETEIHSFVMVGMLILTVINVARTVSKYPMRIYRNPLENKYIATFQHFIPLLRHRVEFAAGELQKTNGWIWKDATYTIKRKKKVLLVAEHFSTPIELERMTIDPNKNSPAEKQKRRSRIV